MGLASAALPHDCTSLPEDDHRMIKNCIISSIPKRVDLMLSHKCCIYKVPERLREVNPEAYTPHLISIGPFHFNNQKLKPMGTQKQVYFHYFWKRLKSEGQDFACMKLEEYKDFLVQNEQEISHHYSEKIQEIINDGENNKQNNEIINDGENNWQNNEIIKDGENNKQNNEIINRGENNHGENNEQNKLWSIILLDSVFIMELFLRNFNKNEQNDDYMFTRPWLSSGMRRDLLLLENQLPFFVLEKLYDLVSPFFNGPGFPDLALYYFKCPIQTDESHPTDIKHFTDLVRQTFKPSCPKFSPYESKVQMSVTKLKKSGINFENAQEKLLNKKDLKLQDIRFQLQKLKMAGINPEILEGFVTKKIKGKAQASRRKDDDPEVQRPLNEGVENSKITHKKMEKLVSLKKFGVNFMKVSGISVLDVKFEKEGFLDRFPWLSCFSYFNVFKARLQIPQFRVDDSTEYKLRNLIAYEQCHDRSDTYVCNYVFLLNSLIDTAEDVDLLVQSKIIHHKLGNNKEVAKLINNLCKNLVISKDCFGKIMSRLYDHYSSSWNNSIATFRSVYFHDLWRTSSTVVGVAVLVLTIMSLVESVF